MKCISKRGIAFSCVLLMLSCSLSGCGRISYALSYDADPDVSSFDVISKQNQFTAESFASDLCVVTEDVITDTANLDEAEAAILMNVSNAEVLYSKNAHEQLYPASLTKVMTALVALKYGSLDQTLTATDSVNITESGAQLCGLKSGDTMTLDQALRILLVYSANDVAMLIAEGVGGTVENFVNLMNEEAQAIGATNTHFANPHGLTDSEHYTTAYDLYLILNEAVKYDSFNEIIRMTSYQTVYYDKDGKEKSFDKTTTNLFLRGDYSAPVNVNIVGGKTGTTNAAGHCLMLYSKDENASSYISVILRSSSTEVLYQEMTDLLDEIHN